MDYFTREFAEEQGLNLDYSMRSLDDLEVCILAHYEDYHALIANRKILDYLTVYISETFRKHLRGKWLIDLYFFAKIRMICLEDSVLHD